jgi:hypothetical protein
MGAPKIKTAGGGGAKPTADAFNNFLLEQIQSGQLGGMMSGQNNPSPLSFNTQQGIESNPMFAALGQMQQNQRGQDLAGLNERFAGPAGRGSVGAIAQGNYLAQANPANVLAMGQLSESLRGQNRADLTAQGQYDISRMGLDQNNLQMLMQALNTSNQLGTPQAQTFMQPSGFSQALGAVSSLAPYALAPFTGGASLGIPGMMGMMGGAGNPMAAGKMQGGGALGGQVGGFNPQMGMNPMMIPGMPMAPISMWGK